ncbi:MAG: hypothetical protein IPI57_15815 [Candidatus Competibacteraceae bacterium]|nr:hypothetical protein [Candidatus Competibacteraceae bacterium]
MPSLEVALSKSQIVGDAVTEYRRLADGKLAVAMCVSIKNAEKAAEESGRPEFRPLTFPRRWGTIEIARRVDAFRAREILVLCNVDMVGEGFDLPGIEALIMLRKTASLTAYRQWIGGALQAYGREKLRGDHRSCRQRGPARVAGRSHRVELDFPANSALGAALPVFRVPDLVRSVARLVA